MQIKNGSCDHTVFIYESCLIDINPKDNGSINGSIASSTYCNGDRNNCAAPITMITPLWSSVLTALLYHSCLVDPDVDDEPLKHKIKIVGDQFQTEKVKSSADILSSIEHC